MSALGQYIHYSWSGYEKYGNYMNQSNWHTNNNRQPTDFNKNIFNEHRRDILREAQGVLRWNNLKQLETSYNTLIEERYKVLIELQSTNPIAYNSIISPLIASLSKDFSSYVVKEIVAGLKFKNGSLVYEPTGKRKSRIRSGNKNSSSRVPYLRWQKKSYSKGKGTLITKRDVALLFDYIKRLKDYISGLDKQNPDIKELEKIQNKLLNEQQVLNSIDKINKELDGSVSVEGMIFISNMVADKYRKAIEDIRFKYVDAEQITQELQATFAEFISGFAADQIQDLSNSEIEKVALNAISEMGRQQSHQIQDKPAIRSLYQPLLKAEYKAEQKDDKKKNIIRRQQSGSFKISNQEILTYTYNLGDLGQDKQGKTDIEMTLFGQTLGVSMKNTDLSKEFERIVNGEMTLSEVELQNSSLLLYLLGAQSYYGENIGNHYLNIFAKHEQEPALAIKMREEATKSLTLYILFSAMTGKGQLRAGREANILAIYDKNPKSGIRIKLFDMYDILNRVDKEIGDKVEYIISPSLKGFVFNNNWAPSGSSERITNILLQARRQNIKAALSHQFLNSILREKDLTS